jgi:hypothetical protein
MIVYRVITTIAEENRTVVKEHNVQADKVESAIRKALDCCPYKAITISVEPAHIAFDRQKVAECKLL